MNKYVFDIETLALPVDQIRAVMPAIEAPNNYTKADSIQSYIAKKEEEYIEKAALNAHTGQVACIGVMLGNDYRNFVADHEDDVLMDFWHFVSDYGEVTGQLIGHNIIGFDIPFLIRRSLACGIKYPKDIVKGRYVDSDIIKDTMQVWAAGDYQARISLKNLAYIMGCKHHKTGSGADFGKLWKTNKEAALKYMEADVRTTHEVATKMGMLD